MSDDDTGRARRKELELLQGRLKEAKADFEQPHTEGYVEEVKRLIEETLEIDADAVMREREVRDAARRLAAVRHDVEEGERQLLAPKVISNVGPGTVALTALSMFVSVWILLDWLPDQPTPFRYVVLGLFVVIPPPLLAWVWKRRLSGGGTFRTPS